ncbi:restriction endonuclease subunit S [Vibrio sp. 10N.247.311.18]|uniref:restriction endonuclease subunit S n=1 Tax=unclassified Vibrio TaxID=2614977 RepID=UPI00354C6FD2
MNCNVNDLVTYVSRGVAPKYTEETSNSAIVINQKCIRDYRVNLELSRLNDLSKRKVLDEKMVQQYDVLVNSTGVGTLGRVAQYLDDTSNLTVDTHVTIVRPNHETIDPLFFGYLMKSKQKLIESFATGTTGQTELSRDSIKEMAVDFISDKTKQKGIASFLLAVDSKLQVNTQTNQTLEQMAQAIFKSWFVDFDPVKAKMNGEQPEGMDAATASLFPEKLVESELGLIPEGWGVGELSKLFELHRGFDLPKSKRQDGEYPVYAAGGYHGAHNEFKMEPPGIITGRSGVIGNVYLSLDKYWPLNTTLYVREFRTCGPYYAYHLLRSLDLKSLNSGSAVPSLNRNFVHSTNVCHPDSDVLAKFEEIVTPLFEKMVANNEQNKSLSELRDTLLPKLLSGEIELGMH